MQHEMHYISVRDHLTKCPGKLAAVQTAHDVITQFLSIPLHSSPAVGVHGAM